MGALVDINTDGLAKLAQTIGNWLGLEARAIERNAEAEAYAYVRKVDAENAANIIRLQGEEQVANYMLAREKRKLNNVQNVIEQAQQHFVEEEQVSDEPVNSDWINRFFTIVEDVSDAEMQQLWARILAGEVKRPKSYSLRTLEVLRNMTKEEAERITQVSPFVLHDGMICSEDFGINIEAQSFLDELGLICGEEMINTYTITPDTPCSIIIDCKQFLYLYSPVEIKVKIKYYKLTKASNEIFTLISRDNSQFINDLANHFKKSKVSKITLNKIVKWEGTKYFFYKDKAIEL